MKPALNVKGRCPGALLPMMSGDGLIVRVRPFYARLEVSQILGLCDMASTYGNGFLDLTNRANIQIRGVQEKSLDQVQKSLSDLGVLDDDPALEARRNVLLTPFWQAGDNSHALYSEILAYLAKLPSLPAKFGFAVDAGPSPLLCTASADIRIERHANGLLVRAEGAALGRPVTQATALSAVHDLVRWFLSQRGSEDRRMAHVMAHRNVPDAWAKAAPALPIPRPEPGVCAEGLLVGAPFGQLDAAALSDLVNTSGALGLRVTPWRMFLLENGAPVRSDAFVTQPGDRLLQTDACPGAPHCASATVETRSLARELTARGFGSLHVSGCAKGCAYKGTAKHTLVGNKGRFDLVSQGHAWDAPEKSGLRPEDLCAELKAHL